MRAIVKRPYFDDLGLHKPGEVVDVACPSDLVELAEDTETAEPEEVKAEEPAVPKKVNTVKKPATKKATKKKG